LSKKQDEVVLSRLYNIPLSRAWVGPRHRRARRAVSLIRQFALKHMKGEEVRLDPEVNELIWMNGITNSPRRITVLMEKSKDDVVKVHLPEKTEELTMPTAEQSGTNSGKSSESDPHTSHSEES
jgi:large subunit ribosomal protein L31e